MESGCLWLSSIGLLLLSFSNLHAQSITVYDSEDHPLPGVEVYTEDLSFAEVTDAMGTVAVDGLSDSTYLFFNFLGLKRVLISISQLRMSGYSLKLEPVNSVIEEIIIFGRSEITRERIPYQTRTIDRIELLRTSPQTAADALDHHGGVYVQKSQMGGGSPIIRGFEANRVLLVVDGVRMNNAVYRNGHLQNAITIDHMMLDRIDVFFGPNSLMYGSDALGGVIHFQSKFPKVGKGQVLGWKTNFLTRYASANNEKKIHVNTSFGNEKIGWVAGATFTDFSDLRTGKQRDERFPLYGLRSSFQAVDNNGQDIVVTNENPHVQVGSAYSQFDAMSNFLWRPNSHQDVGFNMQYSTSSHIPRYDNLFEPKNDSFRFAEWYYGPQERFMSSVRYKYINPWDLFDKASVIGSYQRIEESRISRDFGSDFRLSNVEDIHVASLTLDFDKAFDKSKKHQISYGLDVQLNTINSTAYELNVMTDEVNEEVFTRYGSDLNKYNLLGSYATYTGQYLDGTIQLLSGIRYTRSSYHLRYKDSDLLDWPRSLLEGISSSNSSFTWSIGTTVGIGDNFKIKSSASSAFRAPNIDDISKVRIQGNEITFPNIELEPERSTNFEGTLLWSPHTDIDISATGYYTRLHDAIVRKNFSAPDGSTTWIAGSDTLQVVASQNVQNAEVYGFSIGARAQISEHWLVSNEFNWIRGREIRFGESSLPLGHIPPLYGQAEVMFDSQSSWQVTGVLKYNGFKSIDQFGGSVDNPEFASPIGSLGWTTLHIYGRYILSDRAEFSLAVENIFDLHYRPFASGISAAGRNIILSFKGSF